MQIALSQLKKKQKAEVEKIENDELRFSLMSRGVKQGVVVEVLEKNLHHILFLMGKRIIMLRNKDAVNFFVSPLK